MDLDFNWSYNCFVNLLFVLPGKDTAWNCSFIQVIWCWPTCRLALNYHTFCLTILSLDAPQSSNRSKYHLGSDCLSIAAASTLQVCISLCEYMLLLVIHVYFPLVFSCNRMLAYPRDNTSLDWSIQSPLKCSQWGWYAETSILSLSLLIFWTVNIHITWCACCVFIKKGTSDWRLFLDTFFGWSYNNCCSTKWPGNILAFSFYGKLWAWITWCPIA